MDWIEKNENFYVVLVFWLQFGLDEIVLTFF